MLLSTYASVPSFITFQALVSHVLYRSMQRKRVFSPFSLQCGYPRAKAYLQRCLIVKCVMTKNWGSASRFPPAAQQESLHCVWEMAFSRSRAGSGVALAVGWQHRRVQHRALSSRAVPTAGPASRCRLPEPRGAPTPAPAPARRLSPTGRAPTGLGSGRRCRPAPMATALRPRWCRGRAAAAGLPVLHVLPGRAPRLTGAVPLPGPLPSAVAGPRPLSLRRGAAPGSPGRRSQPGEPPGALPAWRPGLGGGLGLGAAGRRALPGLGAFPVASAWHSQVLRFKHFLR